MNYLAHAYLSFGHPAVLAGNMTSDFIKGKKQYEFPAQVQAGIRLHRLIDTFTDAHPLTKEAKLLLKPGAGAYAGAFLDVVYDHFLANDETIFPGASLAGFTQRVYRQLEDYETIFPERFARMFPYMRSQDWLLHYRETAGIEKSFGGLARRAVYLHDPAPAFALFLRHRAGFQSVYNAFFPELRAFALSQFETLLNQ